MLGLLAAVLLLLYSGAVAAQSGLIEEFEVLEVPDASAAPESLAVPAQAPPATILPDVTAPIGGVDATGNADREDKNEATREGRPPEDIEDHLTDDVQYRQRPGSAEPEPSIYPPYIYESVPDIDSSASDFVSIPDRWRQYYVGKWWDPYNQNILKADLPIFGDPAHPWFVELSVISDTMFEARRLPIPVGGASTAHPQSTDTFGNGHQHVIVENLVTSFSLIQGNTSFKPQDFEFRITPVFNLNHADVEETGALRADPSKGTTRLDNHMGLLEWFADIHLANISERYDFVSTRIGIQPFISDFRGFIYNTSEPGLRLFGNYDNNKWQYNLAYFRRLDKDTNSGINTTFDDRYEDVYIANLYRQDAPVLGHQLQASVVHREDSAGNHAADYDNNGFLVRPASIGDQRDKNISSTYLGLNGDGHIGRVNLTESVYYVTGSESHNAIAGRETEISAGMAALEASYDIDWVRLRASLFWASGDDDPFDDKARGFDAIFDNPNFAGGDISFWQRQGIPFIGGGGVNLVNRNSLLPNLRPGKEEGQSNFVNPGLRLYNAGVDVDVTPKLKLINNLSFLQFDRVDTLKTLRQDGSFDRDIGWDVSSGLLYRPFLNNNVQVRMGGAALFTKDGFDNLFGDRRLYQFFTNLILQY